MKAQALGTVVVTLLLYVLGGSAYMVITLIKTWQNWREKVEKKN
jgi:hypothetical protein